MSGKMKSNKSLEARSEAEKQITEMQKEIDYNTRDYTVELLIDKFNKGDFFIPSYQRKYIWRPSNKSLFIESVILGLPIPFMFFGNCDDGRMEVIDGAQRMQTLVSFCQNELRLDKLKKLEKLNKFKFVDLLESQQRKLLNRTLRIIVLEEDTPNNVRQDLFNRINTSGVRANDSEIRRGAFPGKLTSFIEELSENKTFVRLCPVSEKGGKRQERFELILRFFAYTNNYQNFVHDVNVFLDKYLVENLSSFSEQDYRFEFERMLNFVDAHFPNGFAKASTSNTTPRVRFEALAVGTALALRQQPELQVKNIEWVDSDEFKKHTTSDASNNQRRLQGRIEYVRDRLLKG